MHLPASLSRSDCITCRVYETALVIIDIFSIYSSLVVLHALIDYHRNIVLVVQKFRPVTEQPDPQFVFVFRVLTCTIRLLPGREARSLIELFMARSSLTALYKSAHCITVLLLEQSPRYENPFKSHLKVDKTLQRQDGTSHVLIYGGFVGLIGTT
jgi:hypothetical protein